MCADGRAHVFCARSGEAGVRGARRGAPLGGGWEGRQGDNKPAAIPLRSGTAKEINSGNNRGQGDITMLCLVSNGQLFGAGIAKYCKRRDK